MMMCTFSETQTKTCSDIDGDATDATDAFNCDSWGAAKGSPEACVGDCEEKNCCGIIIIIIMIIIVYGLFVFFVLTTQTRY